MSDAPKLDVIAVGAHPDDVEIACGGTLARLVDQGYRVGIIDLTDGNQLRIPRTRSETEGSTGCCGRIGSSCT
ncbi:MAG: PIG-L family deacetylase [Pirellulaceae bacterium]